MKAGKNDLRRRLEARIGTQCERCIFVSECVRRNLPAPRTVWMDGE